MSIDIQSASKKVIRAAYLAALAESQDIPLAKMDKNIFSGKEYLSLLNYGVLGYPLGDELISFTQMSSNEDSDSDNEEFTGITNLDIQIDDAKAFLHDKLLNISPKFELTVSIQDENPILNINYEKALRESIFAGKIESNSAEVLNARKFLFPEDENGLSVKSDSYKVYEDYADTVHELELNLEQAMNSGSNANINHLSNKLQRTKAEWVTLGKKNQVDQALKILSEADALGGFEDERNFFLEILESRKRSRLGSALDYATVKISPLDPIIDPDVQESWTNITLNKDDIRNFLTPDYCSKLDISQEELSITLDNFQSAKFEFVHTLLSREWFRKDFLTARYWKNSNGPFSDGKGNGSSPTVVTSVYFIKSAELSLTDEFSVSEGAVSSSTPTKKLIAYKPAKTPIMKQLISNKKLNKLSPKMLKSMRMGSFSKLENIQKLKTIEHKKIKTFTVKDTAITRKPVTLAKPTLIHRRSINPAFIKPALINPTFIKPIPEILPANRKPPKNRKEITISGKITCKDKSIIDSLNLTFENITSENISIFNKAANITQSTNDTYIFNIKTNNNLLKRGVAKNQSASVLLLNLKNEKGELIAFKQINYVNKHKTINLLWVINQSSIDIELTSKISPTLFAYGLEVLPLCPNPNAALFTTD